MQLHIILLLVDVLIGIKIKHVSIFTGNILTCIQIAHKKKVIPVIGTKHGSGDRWYC